uniref:hypothetical protein n=1 Tax=Flavobacterium sp. TaxID=239 RepID=UPI0040499BD0
MGFGFNLFFVFVLVPLTGIILVSWFVTKKKVLGRTLGILWLIIFILAMFSGLVQTLTAKKKLIKKDYYGQYIVNRDYFPGIQADWQYENFRFDIKENDSIFFYVTDKEKIIKIFKGTIETTKPYSSERLIINMDQPTHHILETNPTIYRSAWSFYLVFYSPKFNNVYFKMGQWKPLEK